MLIEADRNGANLRFINRASSVIDTFAIAPRSVP
jgi:hypothetical protein